jgi:hypothetical protein
VSDELRLQVPSFHSSTQFFQRLTFQVSRFTLGLKLKREAFPLFTPPDHTVRIEVQRGADVAQLVEQSIRKGLSFAHVVESCRGLKGLKKAFWSVAEGCS